MYRIDNDTALTTLPLPKAPGTPGYFTNGDLPAGIPATIVDADWMNCVQEELANVVEEAGDELDKADRAQLLKAIQLLARKTPYVPGQIIAYAGKQAPTGTLACNGAAVSRTQYADLFAAIGTTYGAGNGTTTFNLPSVKEGTVISHTNDPAKVGQFTAGQTIAHTHGATSATVGDHTHYIGVYGAGGHGHGASADAVGDHTHGAWTDAQGWHGHTGSTTSNGGHSHSFGSFPQRYTSGTSQGFHESNGGAAWTSHTGDHTHALYVDGNGTHGHNVAMNGAGNHSHTINIAAVGDHAHTLDNRGAGAHGHTITVNSSGGSDNLPAGLRMMYCIAY